VNSRRDGEGDDGKVEDGVEGEVAKVVEVGVTAAEESE